MQPQTLDGRVERLEVRVTILEELPARVDALTSQVSQLREEMHVEFSAVRGELQTRFSELGGSLHEKLRAVADEIMGQARSLHENALSRIALMGEGRPNPPKRE